jgi:sugar phosphate permease
LTTGTGLDIASRPNWRLFRWQTLTILLMVVGYSGYYLCRSNFSVALPLITSDLASKGMSPDLARIRLGTIASIGVLAYALGKFPSGSTADFFGGRRNFLTGMVGSVLFTVLFALGGGIPIFTIAWFGNRLIQSQGWAGMVKISSKWFSFSTYGTVMGIVSLSYLFGDAVSRLFMGMLIGKGLTWRALFLVTAAVLLGLAVINGLFLKESPREIGEPEPPSNPLSLFGQEGDKPKPSGLWALFGPFFKSYAFWLVCLISLGTTLVRETFNLWTPTYFVDVVGMTKADAALKSGAFSFVGGLSVLLVGFLSDRLGRSGRAAIIFIGLVLTVFGLLGLAYGNFHGSALIPVVLVAAVGFSVIGPYAYLAGAISLDFGGKQGSATASGLIDGVGYLGGIAAGDSIARISVSYGWRGAFVVLACGTLATSFAAFAYLRNQMRPAKMALKVLS